jgi:hypothetical protein
MKSYRNEILGFEMDMPAEWSYEVADQLRHMPGNVQVLIFRCRQNETFSIRKRSLEKEPELLDNEIEFRRSVQELGHTSLMLGRIFSNGKEHVWARYYEGYGHWTKKYILNINRIEYVLTAACTEQKSLLEMEKTWDAVVGSFCLLGSTAAVIPPAFSTMVQPPAGTRKYINQKHGFEIYLPENWEEAPEIPPAFEVAFDLKIPPGLDKDCFQYGCIEEAVNFEIAPLFPEPLLDDTVIEFKIFAQMRRFKDLQFGRIIVAGKEHVCAHYFIDDAMGQRWNKKYMLVFGGIEYALTCTCTDPDWFSRREKDWDEIICSFRMLRPVDESANTSSQADKERQERRIDVQKRAEMVQDPWKMYAKACEAMALDQLNAAAILLGQYLNLEPGSARAHKDLARIQERQGDMLGAIQHLKEVVRLDPADSSSRSHLVRLESKR